MAGAGIQHRLERFLLVFQIGGERCALPVESVQEIVHLAALSRAPGQPPVMEGFLNLRGSVVPVIRLCRLFDLPGREPGLYTPLIVLRGAASPLALLADEVLEIATASEDSLHALGETETLNGCASHLAEIGGVTVHVLSPERLLLERERLTLAELQAEAQRCLDELEGSRA